MRTSQEIDRLREQAIILRRAGKSLRQIKQILGPMSNATLNDALRDEPPPEWTRRPNAKDDRRARARAIAYWCEGTKNKPHRRDDRVAFMNSDPSLIRFFLRFLDTAGTPRTDLAFRVFIHESADVESAQRFWLEITGAPPEQFLTPTLKRHNPATVRKNVGENYHGCLRVDVHRGADLYHRIEGWVSASME